MDVRINEIVEWKNKGRNENEWKDQWNVGTRRKGRTMMNEITIDERIKEGKKERKDKGIMRKSSMKKKLKENQ